MQIIIPMVGESVRFKKAGYKIPKFLLKINNQYIIEHIIDLFPGEKDFLFICNKKHLANKKLRLTSILKKKCPGGKIIGIKSHKLGPVYSVLKIINKIEDNKPIIVNYCDFNCYWNYKNFKKIIKKKYDGNIVVYKDFHPSTTYNSYYAYIKEKNGRVTDIREKKPFTKNPTSEYTSSGTYYFKNKEILHKYFHKTIKDKLKTNGEYYISMVYKSMIKDSKKVGYHKINFFSQWGSPEDFNEYKNWSEKFEKIIQLKKTKKIKGILLIPAAGQGKRFQAEGYKIHKPLIEISGKPMLIQSILLHPNHQSTKIVISKRNIFYTKLKQKIKKYLPNANTVTLNKFTKGQAITCLEGLKDENTEKPLTIGSCDTGIMFNDKKFFKLFNDIKTDIIVWSVKNHYESVKNPKQFGWIKSKKNIINSISVKKPIRSPSTDPIVLGTFTFKKTKYFIRSVERMIRRKAMVNNEYYIDTCINDAISLGYKCKIFSVDVYLPWGNPNDLKTFKYWQEYFHFWKKHPYKIKNLI